MGAASEELHRRDERNRLLLAEFNHRIKNTLSVVVSLVQQTLSDRRAQADSRDLLVQRLHALARTHDLLTARNWDGAPLADIAAAELAPYGSRATIDGPRLVVGAGIAQTFALLLHELATNAAKYGALSSEGGRVFVKWWIAGKGDAALFHFQWQEEGGPPVSEPARKGFGTMLLQGALPAAESPPRIDFAPDGLRYSFEAPLSAIERTSEAGA
jgi:two-component sensor histidine kinase